MRQISSCHKSTSSPKAISMFQSLWKEGDSTSTLDNNDKIRPLSECRANRSCQRQGRKGLTAGHFFVVRRLSSFSSAHSMQPLPNAPKPNLLSTQDSLVEDKIPRIFFPSSLSTHTKSQKSIIYSQESLLCHIHKERNYVFFYWGPFGITNDTLHARKLTEPNSLGFSILCPFSPYETSLLEMNEIKLEFSRKDFKWESECNIILLRFSEKTVDKGNNFVVGERSGCVNTAKFCSVLKL